jgi:hypothetical protein
VKPLNKHWTDIFLVVVGAAFMYSLYPNKWGAMGVGVLCSVGFLCIGINIGSGWEEPPGGRGG